MKHFKTGLCDSKHLWIGRQKLEVYSNIKKEEVKGSKKCKEKACGIAPDISADATVGPKF